MEDPRAERAVMLGVLAVAAVIGIALVSGGTAPTDISSAAAGDQLVNSFDPEPTTTITAGTPATGAPAAAPTTSTSTTTSTPAGADPGALPQTDQRPVASGAAFEDGGQGLWQAIVQDDPKLAMPFFFPKSAYLQVKAISDPATDYEQRLIANYEQDIHALHLQLGGGAGSAQFVGIDVPDSQAVLVQPGEESNKLSYWRVYGTKLRYSVNGTTNTFPVTSLISWRGEWYVVHLGEIR